MAWIETVDPAEATGKLGDLYAAIATSRGGVAAVHRITSLNPRVVASHLEIYKSIMFARSPLDRAARERIGVVVSAANQCAYCVEHHAEALSQVAGDDEPLEALKAGEIPDSLAPEVQLLLRWTQLIATDPAASRESHVAELRASGYSDRALLDASLVASYFCFVNRLVLSLGVELEPDYAETCRES